MPNSCITARLRTMSSRASSNRPCIVTSVARKALAVAFPKGSSRSSRRRPSHKSDPLGDRRRPLDERPAPDRVRLRASSRKLSARLAYSRPVRRRSAATLRCPCIGRETRREVHARVSARESPASSKMASDSSASRSVSARSIPSGGLNTPYEIAHQPGVALDQALANGCCPLDRLAEDGLDPLDLPCLQERKAEVGGELEPGTLVGERERACTLKEVDCGARVATAEGAPPGGAQSGKGSVGQLEASSRRPGRVASDTGRPARSGNRGTPRASPARLPSGLIEPAREAARGARPQLAGRVHRSRVVRSGPLPCRRTFNPVP